MLDHVFSPVAAVIHQRQIGLSAGLIQEHLIKFFDFALPIIV